MNNVLLLEDGCTKDIFELILVAEIVHVPTFNI